jgi:hypothetical protein
MLVNYMREYQLQHGADQASAYQSVLHVMAGLLVVGFVANLLVRPVAQQYWLSEKPEQGRLGGVTAAVSSRA